MGIESCEGNNLLGGVDMTDQNGKQFGTNDCAFVEANCKIDSKGIKRRIKMLTLFMDENLG